MKRDGGFGGGLGIMKIKGLWNRDFKGGVQEEKYFLIYYED